IPSLCRTSLRLDARSTLYARNAVRLALHALRPRSMEHGKPAPRTRVLSLRGLLPSHLRSNRAIRPPSGRIADPYDDWAGRDPETGDQRREYYSDLAPYRSAYSLYSHLVSPSTTDPKLHGIPRKEGGKADPSMAVDRKSTRLNSSHEWISY